MKKALFILGGIAVVGAGAWAIYRFVIIPTKKFKFISVDWANRVVNYEHPMGSGTVDYKSLQKSGGQGLTSGDWVVEIKPNVDQINFTLKKGSTILDNKTVDFTSKKIV